MLTPSDVSPDAASIESVLVHMLSNDNDLRPAVGGSISGTTRLPTEPLQCEQQAGEVMFVPKKWLHAVSNTAPSIGVAIELG